MRARVLLVLGALLAMMAVAVPARAIKGGVPDEGAHTYVGQLLFYDPTAIDPRFDDPGGWFNCSGTRSRTTASCRRASEFIPDDNEGRYEAWSTALNASDEWIRATAYPHPDYEDAAFFTHDLGFLQLSEPVILPEYGQLPTEGLLDELYAEDKQQPYTAVGYGLEGSGPKTSFGGDTRRRAELRLVNLNGVLGAGKGTAAKFSSNANTGGTCFGDSGGPIFVFGTTTLVAVVSFGTSSTCSGTSGAYRIDQADDLAFLASFGIVP